MYIKPAIHWCYIYIARPQLSTAAKLVFRGNSVRQTLCGDLSIRTNHHKCPGPTLINDISTNRWLRDPKHYDDDDLITYKHIECVLLFILLHKGIVMEIYHWVFKLDASPSLDRTKGPSVLLGYFFRCPTHIYWPLGFSDGAAEAFVPRLIFRWVNIKERIHTVPEFIGECIALLTMTAEVNIHDKGRNIFSFLDRFALNFGGFDLRAPEPQTHPDDPQHFGCLC